jgi:hypothetical protein
MAYDASPEETADWIPVGRGRGAIFAKPSKDEIDFWKKQVASKKAYARLDPDLRKAFPDDKSVNGALREFLKNLKNGKRRKSA